MVERRTENPCVGSSILPSGTDVVEERVVRDGGGVRDCSSVVERAAHNRLVDGSIPSSPTRVAGKEKSV